MDNKKVLKKIGNKVKEFRKLKGFSQEQFANESNIERAFYGKFENQGRNITINSLIKISLTLNVNIGELFPDISEIKSILNEDN